MPEAVADTSCSLRGYRWDLRYTASALRVIQMTQGSLESFAQQAMNQNFGMGLSSDTQALLIWAGQLAADPKIKLGQVKRRLTEMGDQGRLIMVNWASIEFCRTVFDMATAQIAAAHPDPTDPEEGDDL